jgi:Fe-S cluster assembly ATP-binding protein
MPLLEIKNLHVEIDGKKILNGLDLTVNKGEVHAIMGPNGSGKSTLAYVLAGKAEYEVTEGEVLFDGENVLEMEPDERAAKGVFLAFQYPIEIPGVATMTFLRTALNAQRKKRGEAELTTPEFMKRVREGAAKLSIIRTCCAAASMSVLRRREEAQRDSCRWRCSSRASRCSTRPTPGLDIDALKIVSEGVNRLRSPERSFVVHHALPAPAQLHRAGHRARALEGPHREDRRQGAGATSSKASGYASSRKPGRGGITQWLN